MFKTILMTAAAALVATAAVAPAHAGWTNGVSLNSIVPNGYQLNGQFENGFQLNGQSLQGTSTGAAGFVIDGIELPARTR